MYWYTSDLHFSHINICLGVTTWEGDLSGCRDFPDVETMNQTIADNINSMVEPNDILYVVGDFCFGGAQKIKEARSMINCRRVRLVYGNHDFLIVKKKELQDLFDGKPRWVRHDKCDGQSIFMFHFPVLSWNDMKHGTICAFGHIHSRPRFINGKSLDVGLEGNDFKPYSLDEIVKYTADAPWIHKLGKDVDSHH